MGLLIRSYMWPLTFFLLCVSDLPPCSACVDWRSCSSTRHHCCSRECKPAAGSSLNGPTRSECRRIPLTRTPAQTQHWITTIVNTPAWNLTLLTTRRHAYGVAGSLITVLFQIVNKVYQWKLFKNWSTFGEGMHHKVFFETLHNFVFKYIWLMQNIGADYFLPAQNCL